MSDKTALGIAIVAAWGNQGNKAACSGDSISRGNNTIPPGSPAFGDVSWFSQALYRAKGKLQYVNNAAVPGERTDQMLARIQTEVIALKPNICFVLGGTNDVGQLIPLADTRSNLETIVKKLLSARILPVLCTIPPRDVDGTGFKLATAKVNVMVQQLAAKYGLHLLDFYSVLVDPATNSFKAGYSTDGVHPNAIAAVKMAELIDPVIARIASREIMLPKTNIEPLNIFSEGLFLNDLNADGVANTWSGSGAGTRVTTLVSGTGAVLGNWQTLEKTSTGDTSTLNAANITTKYAVGDRLVLVGRLKATLQAGAATLTVQVNCIGGGVTFRPMSNWTTDLDTLIYYEYVVPAGTTTISFTASLSAGTGSFQLAQMGMYNLSTLGG